MCQEKREWIYSFVSVKTFLQSKYLSPSVPGSEEYNSRRHSETHVTWFTYLSYLICLTPEGLRLLVKLIEPGTSTNPKPRGLLVNGCGLHLHLFSKWGQTRLTSNFWDWSGKNIPTFQSSSLFPCKTSIIRGRRQDILGWINRTIKCAWRIWTTIKIRELYI